jgi:hypothetical protein
MACQHIGCVLCTKNLPFKTAFSAQGAPYMATMANFKKIVAIFIGIIILTCLIWAVYLSMDYAYSRPQNPQSEIGRIYPLNVHGTIIYLTKDEDLQLKLLVLIGGIFFFIGFFYTLLVNPFNQDK